jgi:hypothetical protein
MAKREDVAYEASKAVMAEMRPKEIVKEGLSEYFLYTIEGTEDLKDNWGKRLVSFTVPKVPVINLYRYEEELYGNAPVRFLSFVNDEKHNLGKEPVPDGLVKVFRNGGSEGALSYVGAQTTKYIPKGGEVNLNLGATEMVSVKPVLMDYSTDNYEWSDKSIMGWDEHKTVRVEVANNQRIPAKVEITRNFPNVKKWEVENEGETGEYAKLDADTVKYVLELPPYAKKVFTYRVTLHQGSRGM